MTWFLSGCARHRREISLLAAQALDPQAAPAAKQHLEQCAACQRYYRQWMVVGDRLRGLAGRAPETTPRFTARWQRAIKATAAHAEHQPANLIGSLTRFWLRNRRILAALTPVWLLILFFRVSTPELAGEKPVQVTHALSEIIRLWKAHEQWRVAGNRWAEPLHQPDKDADARRPRSGVISPPHRA